MDTVLSMIVIASLPIMASLILQLIFTSKNHESVPYLKKQIIAGVVFGVLAILGTEYGVPYNGAIINVRDSAPLCAGMIFGPWAGIISGIIGGIERWLCVYWGGGYYTRTACSIATIVSGLLAAVIRKDLFDDRSPNPDHAMIAAAVAESFHMLMIFFTNINDIKTAFNYVHACTIPMVLINTLSVGIAVLITKQLDKRHAFDNDKTPSISVRFLHYQIIVVLIAFITTTLIGHGIQKNISKDDTLELLNLSLSDVESEIVDQVDQAILHVNRLVANYLIQEPDADLNDLKGRYEVDEICVINSNGIIIASSAPEDIGFNMAEAGEQSAEFMKLLEDGGPSEMVQAFMPTAKDESIYKKYSGVRIPNGIVQVAYDGYYMSDEIKESLRKIAANRHVGETGSLLVLDRGNQVVSATKDSPLAPNKYYNFIEYDTRNNEEYVMYRGLLNNVDYYYMIAYAENYTILAAIPKIEAEFSKDMSTYLNVLLQTEVFGALFVAIYLIIKNGIVRSIHMVNDSLTMITEGNLDTVVNVRSTKEFSLLSDGINTTVDALKRYIAEANERIDTELRYAKEIQISALPTIFPAFPERSEFDIYAIMDPAREVGGDFYDFYMIDDDTLVFLIADVAGKGIPASLFMMRAKSIIKTFAENKINVADIFTNANYELCDGNDAGMFVTSWIGFLNLRTGELKYANAGHNPPLLRRKNGEFEYMQGPPGFVLAGMEGVAYQEQRTVLEPGDEIFLYTDGVVEATNIDKQLYGEARLHEFINKHIGEDSMTLCKNVKKDVEDFYEGAPQFDDITELSLQYKHHTE
ncbi:MAG: SpoIIE family protein phosphatase [Erysipelotrichaceae bacterium]|nr:SpoIIE family protein phosphatase [Erysipelotrichaceae bacterium]